MERGIAAGVRAEQVAALDSWEQLYNAYQPGIMRYLLGMCCEPALADELTQEVFVRAATHALLFRGESSLSSTCASGLPSRRSSGKAKNWLVVT